MTTHDKSAYVNSLLDQAIAASGEVRTSTIDAVLPTPANVAEWPVTGIQIPWKEWVALVDAIRANAR